MRYAGRVAPEQEYKARQIHKSLDAAKMHLIEYYPQHKIVSMQELKDGRVEIEYTYMSK